MAVNKDTLDLITKARDNLKEQSSEYEIIEKHLNSIKSLSGVYFDNMNKLSKTEKDIERTLTEQSKIEAENLALHTRYDKMIVSESIIQKNAMALLEKRGFQLGKNYKIIRDIAKDSTDKLNRMSKEIQESEYLLQLNKKDLNVLGDKYKSQLRSDVVTKSTKSLMSGISGLVGESAGGMSSFASSMINVAKEAGPLGLALAVIVELIKFGVGKFLEIDKAAFNLRKEFGLLRDDSKEYLDIIKDVTVSMIGFGITADMVEKSVAAIGNEFLEVNALDKDMVKDMSLFNSQLGISEELSAKLIKTMATISGQSTKSAASMEFFAIEAAKAYGVPLPKVLKDIANLSEDVRLTFIGTNEELIKTISIARQMGTSIDSEAKSAEKLLNFYDSVNQEMDTGILLGKNINMQEARRLAYVGDLRGMNDEILKQVRTLGDFDTMTMYQKKGLSALTGKSIEELETMNQRENDRNRLMQFGSDKVKESLGKQAYLQMHLNDLKQKSLAQTEEEFMQNLKNDDNREKMVKLQSVFNEKMMELGVIFIPIVNTFLDLAIKFLPAAIKIGETLFSWAVALKSVFVVAEFISKWSLSLTGFLLKIIGAFDVIVEFGSKFSWVAKVAGFFGKWLEPIGWVIAGIQFIVALWKEFNKESFSWSDGIGPNILKGLFAIGRALYDVLIQPFVDAWHWLSGLWTGKSPSKLGLMIVNGISSIGRMLFDALISPYKMAWDLITSIFSMDDIGSKILDTFKSIGDVLYNLIIMPFKKGFDFILDHLPSFITGSPVLNLPSTDIKGASTQDVTSQQQTLMDGSDKIVGKIDELIKVLRDGGIAVYLDGRQVNKQLASVI